jgi:predicted metal-binding protein
MDHGATNAKIIEKNNIIIDPRARLKCYFPKCHHFGTNIHCPPHMMDVDQIKEAISLYEYAVLLMLKTSPERVLATADEKEKIADRRLMADLISRVEGAAFYDGYYFSLGFGTGSCKMTWCPTVPCQALEQNGTCRFPLKSRPSMESAGFNVFKMAANVGWDIYPIGSRCTAEQIPHAIRVGLILIG